MSTRETSDPEHGCTVARPVAVRGLPVLGLNARGSGHHYRQEVRQMQDEDNYWRDREERRRDRWANTIHTVVLTLCVIGISAVLAYVGLYVFDYVIDHYAASSETMLPTSSPRSARLMLPFSFIEKM